MTPGGIILRRGLAHAMRPILAAGLPGSGRLVRATGVDRDEVWEGTPPAVSRLRWHAGVVRLDRSERWERLAWLYSRYHELPLLLFMNAILRPGDSFVDVGANLGLVSLHAWRLVGSTGSVIAFEPNPDVRERLRAHVSSSHASVTVDGRALGDGDGEFELSVLGANTGSGTLGTIPDHLRDRVRSTYKVTVVAGDEVSGLPVGNARMLIKIDAEGSEFRVLKGLDRTLRARRPVVVTEVNPFALRMNGSNPRQLAAYMRSLGYEGFELEARRKQGWRSMPELAAMRPPAKPGLRDVVWTHPQGPWQDEIQRMIALDARIIVAPLAAAATSSSPAPTPAPSAPAR